MIEHFIVSPTWDERYLVTLCGSQVLNQEMPEGEHKRCESCTLRIPMIANAREYARQRGITPAQAGRALNLPAPVVRELRLTY